MSSVPWYEALLILLSGFAAGVGILPLADQER